jgi:hypothetical protein
MAFTADAAKVALMAIPGLGTEASIALIGGEAALRKSAEVAGDLSERDDVTSYEAAREATLALVPRDESGEVDQGKLAEWVSKIGEGLSRSEVKENLPEDAHSYLGVISEKVKNDPHQLIEAMIAFDAVAQERKVK